MEITLSSFAWLGVVLIQALVHYTLTLRRKYLDEEDGPAMDASPLVLERTQGKLNTEASVSSEGVETAASSSHSVEDLDGDEVEDVDSLDGDEPEYFFELLSQTGSEMMSVRFPGISLDCSVIFSDCFHLFFCYTVSIAREYC